MSSRMATWCSSSSTCDADISEGALDNQEKVLVDRDPPTAVRNRDVDDGLALLVLLAKADIDPLGITVNSGNVPAKAGFAVAKKILGLLRDSPVSRFLVEAISPWLSLDRKVFSRAKGFFPWDVVSAAHVIAPALLDSNPCSFLARGKGLRSGSIRDFRWPSQDQSREAAFPLNLPMELDTGRFMSLFMEGLLEH